MPHCCSCAVDALADQGGRAEHGRHLHNDVISKAWSEAPPA